MKKLCKRLYIGLPHIGGKLSPNLVVEGYTEIQFNGILFRSHLFYANKGCCYNWTYFEWEGINSLIIGKIMMIIDLSNCDIMHDMDQDPDTILDDASKQIISHLIKEKRIVISAAETDVVDAKQLSDILI